VRLVIKSLSEKAGAPTVEVDAGVGPAVDAEFVVVDEFVDVADVGVGAELLLFCNAICWSKLCKSDALVDAPTLLIVIPLTSQKGSLQVSVRAFSHLG
jgi:hypothetical protein